MYEKYNVLFVDDEINILQAIRRGLLDEEFGFLGAMSGQEAIEIMERNKVDVVVTDMRMPEMNGLQLLHTITERWPKTVKIVLTGFTQITQIIATINQIDIFRFLTKPWKIDELIAVIRKALDLYIMQEENAHYKEKLESQNRTYQMLLRKFNDVLSVSQFNSDFLGVFGRALFDFECRLGSFDREKYARLLDMRGELFEAFNKALTVETTDMSADDLNKALSDYILEHCENAVVAVTPDATKKFRVRLKLFEAVLYALCEVFAEEFFAFGSRVYLGNTKESAYSVLVQCPLGGLADTGGDITATETKLGFASALLKDALSLCGIDFQARHISDSIVLAINMDHKKNSAAPAAG